MLYLSSHYPPCSESPYAEVRAAVSTVDDPTMPVNTFRSWLLGLFFALVISALNQLFEMRCLYILTRV